MIEVKGKQYVSPQEAAKMLAIHHSTVYSWCRHGEVELLTSLPKDQPLASKYLIEVKSLNKKHARTHLDAT